MSSLISAPCCYGKLPSLGDYFQYNAPQEEVAVWWNRFFRFQERGWLKADSSLPWCFVLPPEVFFWSGSRYVVGVMGLSEDRIARRYPFVVWQKASPQALRHPALFGAPDEEQPLNWLFWLSRLVGLYTLPPHSGGSPENAQTFARNMTELWKLYRPDWRCGLGALFGSLPGSGRLPQEADIQRQIPTVVPNPLEGVRYLPWSDWPERLLSPRAQCCFWQQDNTGRYLHAVQDRNFSSRLLPLLFGAGG